MHDTYLFPAPEASAKRRFWRLWKWVCLTLFALALLLKQWLPDVVYGIGALAGIALIINVTLHAIRYLRDKLFWRVRYRLMGSFVFIGLIPLLLALGVLFLVAYMVTGQLAASYLEDSLSGIAGELTRINLTLGERLAAASGKVGLDAVAPSPLEAQRARFPRVSVRLLEPQPDKGVRVVQVFDPGGVAAQFAGNSPVPADDAAYDGFWRVGEKAFLISLHPVLNMPGLFLEVSAPLDEAIVRRIETEKRIYVAFLQKGVKVARSATGVQVRVSEGPGSRDPESEELIRAMEVRSRQEQSRTIWWLAILQGRSGAGSAAGDIAAVAVIRVPLVVLYKAYLAGYSDLGRVLLVIVWVLLSLFLAAVMISVVIGISISRRITRSVHDMYQGMLALREGNLEHRIPVRRQDQLGLLAHSFNQMTGSITRLLEEVSEKKRLEQELEIAREVQATLFPKQLPRPRGLSIFGGCEPARTVSGDYYDFVVEDETRLHIVVADISGKGISAALLMANLQAVMRNQLMAVKHGSAAEIESRLANVVGQLNRQIFQNSPSGKYATLFLGRFDAESRELCYCNAGHLPPVLLHNGSIERLEAGGTVVGLFEQTIYEARTIPLKPGTVMALFTDGVTEAVNEQDEEYGEERLIESLARLRNSSPEMIYRSVSEDIKSWQGPLKQHDDITLIIGRVD